MFNTKFTWRVSESKAHQPASTSSSFASGLTYPVFRLHFLQILLVVVINFWTTHLWKRVREQTKKKNTVFHFLQFHRIIGQQPRGRGLGPGVGGTLSRSSWLPWIREGPPVQILICSRIFFLCEISSCRKITSATISAFASSKHIISKGGYYSSTRYAFPLKLPLVFALSRVLNYETPPPRFFSNSSWRKWSSGGIHRSSFFITFISVVWEQA